VETHSGLSGSWVRKDGTLDPRARYGLRLAGLALLLMGVVPLVKGVVPAVFGVKAEGQVVEIVEYPQRRGRRYDAVIEFVAADGRAVRIRRLFQHPVSRRTSVLAVGDRVSVAYLRDREEEAEVQDHRTGWAGGGLTPVLLGIIFAAVSFVGRRPRRAGS
jgi:hypothetical protein